LRIRTTFEADDDISRLYASGFQSFGVAQADSYLLGLRKLFELLAGNPFIARERIEFDPPVRVHPYGSHIVVYRVEGRALLVLRVLHGRRDWQREVG